MSRKPRPLARLREIEAVVFDLDGVLVDSEPVHFRASNRVLGRYGAHITEAEYRQFIGWGETATWDAWRRSFQLPVSVAQLIAAIRPAMIEEVAAGVPAIDDAVSLARQLHAAGTRLAIASSSPPEIIHAELVALGLDSVFSVRASGEDPDVRESKPAPDVYIAAAARLGITPAACLAIEDSATGVTSAKRAGLSCIAVPTEWTLAGDFREADVVLESLRYFPLVVL